MSGKGKRIVAQSLLLLSCLCVLPGCTDTGRSRFFKATEKPKEITVRVVEVVSGQTVRTDCYVGTVEAGRKTVVSAPASGTLAEVNCRTGETVPAGRMLALVDSPVLKSAYDVAESKLNQAEDGWERIEKLKEAGSVAEVKVVEVQTALLQARAAEQAARESLEDCQVKAPFPGIVERVYVSAGTKVLPGEPLFEIVDAQTPEIRFQVPENEYSGIRTGGDVEVLVPAVGVSFPGKIISKGVQASRLSHSYECTVKLGGRQEGVMPGMVCKVFVRTSGEESIVIPAGAVCIDMDGRCVWVVEDGIVGKRPVVTGDFSGQGVIIREGLSPGDEVITEGMTKVSVGMKVNTIR